MLSSSLSRLCCLTGKDKWMWHVWKPFGLEINIPTRLDACEDNKLHVLRAPMSDNVYQHELVDEKWHVGSIIIV